MATFRTEISIPVNKDNRTFEERHNEMFNELGKKYSESVSCRNSKVVSHEKSSKIRRVNHNSIDRDQFFNNSVSQLDTDMSDWLSNSRKKWNDEVDSLKKSMFSLESGRDEFDFKSMDPWRNRQTLNNFPRHESEIQREHQVTTNQNGCHQRRETSQSVFTSSTKPINISERITPADNELKPVYEMGSDDQLYFKLRFESKNFKPEDIKITCCDSTLNICAKKSTITDNCSKGELQKSIFIPSCVNSQKFECHLTEDGILVLEAPVSSPDYSTIVESKSQKIQQTDRQSAIKIKNTVGPVVLFDEDGKRIHIEIQVDREYVLTDFSISTENNNISVKGRHEMKTSNSSSFKEFSRFYETNERLDPSTIQFILVDCTLVIEAMVL